MALSGISPPTSISTNPQTDPRLLFMQLSKAIGSGDLNGAQQAYAQLTQALGGTGASGNANDPFSQALAAIGQSLQSGDIGGAQQALASLQQQMQATRGHHHRGHHGGGQASAGSGNVASSAAATVTVSNGTSGNAVDVTA